MYESYGCHDDGDASAESFEHMLASLNDCWLLVHRRDCLAFEDQLAKVLQSRISRGVGRPTDIGEGTIRGSEQMDKVLQLLPARGTQVNNLPWDAPKKPCKPWKMQEL